MTYTRSIHHLTLATAFVGLAGVSTASAQVAHTGQPITEHVVLEGYQGQFSDAALICDFRPLPAKDERAFLVPDGHRLVVTDVEWQAVPTVGDGGHHFPAGASAWAQVMLASMEKDGPFSRVFRSRTVHATQETAALGTSEQLTTGFTVPPKTRICFFARHSVSASSGAKSAFLTDVPLGGYGNMGGVILRGYVIKEN